MTDVGASFLKIYVSYDYIVLFKKDIPVLFVNYTLIALREMECVNPSGLVLMYQYFLKIWFVLIFYSDF